MWLLILWLAPIPLGMWLASTFPANAARQKLLVQGLVAGFISSALLFWVGIAGKGSIDDHPLRFCAYILAVILGGCALGATAFASIKNYGFGGWIVAIVIVAAGALFLGAMVYLLGLSTSGFA